MPQVARWRRDLDLPVISTGPRKRHLWPPRPTGSAFLFHRPLCKSGWARSWEGGGVVAITAAGLIALRRNRETWERCHQRWALIWCLHHSTLGRKPTINGCRGAWHLWASMRNHAIAWSWEMTRGECYVRRLFHPRDQLYQQWSTLLLTRPVNQMTAYTLNSVHPKRKDICFSWEHFHMNSIHAENGSSKWVEAVAPFMTSELTAFQRGFLKCRAKLWFIWWKPSPLL